ncbi:vacuolar protein sorting-associated protein 13B isoform X1 [Nasonia vitripennis]|uniref:Chorein N-terminal domain-containing protein n=1 Tax=Nasonia vitripennis TaxID=7425 RepID=A0A7M7H491_NASVI|nr:vacuolar protein sorting-associated protein 13B isoform X1 [Nasonia vitripennis]XP_008205595.1 vacuolar protein sorting-associated protein 13B isoform X1 [Nasonia vitripennis]
MFKLESYITPVILSYVEKYVKNFKPEQSQVSLWGGDASFQNLNLRLEVLEEQLNLPFTFVSGHIHELLIHVPWVKITSEPIVVTINTIECILKLKDEKQSDNNTNSNFTKQIEIPQDETPPGYIKSIVTKVINNITINCNNLILKYVEEDIVLSINVRFLSMQTVDNKWEPAFTDISSYEVKLQKIITVQDLTLCLDKMDTSGKIEIYQDPVLYRCSMIIRLIMNYHSNIAKRASITRLDLHCQKMEFSITEQQIPMILRLLDLLSLLQSRQFPTAKEKSYVSPEESENVSQDELTQAAGSTGDIGWGMWAWNTMSSILPMDWDNEWASEQNLAYSGHVIHFGFYVDNATITFKTVESVKEQLFYKSRKIKYKSFLSLRFSEAVLDVVLQGISMTNFTLGFGSIRLYPRGTCSCGFLEVVDGAQPPLYLTAGLSKKNYLKDTLFDNEAIENEGKKRVYKKDVTYHLASVTMPTLLERCPAFFMDYVHYTEISDDISPERLAEFGSCYEYSNFHEERHIRYGVGNLIIRLCSGLFHRIDTIKQASEKYDYSPYLIPKPAPSFDELPPVTVEEYEALRENIPIVNINVHIVKSAIQLQLADHRITGLPRHRNYLENRTMPLTPALSDDPFLSIECDSISAALEQPLYPFRLAACASKQTEIPPEMLTQCYRDIKLKSEGVNSQVYLKTNCRTSIIMPCNMEGNLRTLLYPEYWRNLDTIHSFHNLKIDAITVTGTKRKIMVASSILTSLLYPDDNTNPLLCSSLYTDSCDEKSPIYIELCLENINYEGKMSLTTTSCTATVNAIKVFAHNETQQAFILSGPEIESQSTAENQALFTAVIQFSKDLNNQRHPAICFFQVASMKGSLDPLLLQWLDYQVTYYKLNTTYTMNKAETAHVNIEGTVSDSGGKKRNFPSLHESVHSSSDKDKRKLEEAIEKSMKKSVNKTNESDKVLMRSDSVQENIQKISILSKLTDLYPWCSSLVLFGSVNHIVIYIPTKTMSGIGVEGIEEAKNQALQSDENLQILVIMSPIISIHSSNVQTDRLIDCFQSLPITLPKKVWIHQNHSFPWTLEMLNFECFTLKGSQQQNFIKKICFKATLDLTSKNSIIDSVKTKLSGLSLCLYVDTSPIIIAVSEPQVIFLNKIFKNIVKVIQPLSRPKENAPNSGTKEVKDISFVVPRSSSSPTQLPYPEDTTTTSTISAIKDGSVQEEEDLQLTACIQWTIAKVALKLYITGEHDHATLKLVLELEDIITSVDIQSVYFKLKHKITTATIFHYTRAPQAQQWDFGDYVGLLLCGREDTFEKSEDSGFLSLTLTVAKSGNVYTRWNARKLHKTQRKDLRTEALQPTDAYITEALVKIQMVDIIVPPSVLAKYIKLVKPFFNDNPIDQNPTMSPTKKVSPPFIGITNLQNESLPLIYLEFKGFRLMLPVASESNQEFPHDLLMIQLDGIRITPHAENPICRAPLRSDIYQLAAQANILNVPGSAVEDRQYQINVDGICAHTTTWKDYQQSVAKRMSQSYLYTMNENPAVEWNKLGSGSSLEPHFSTLPVITRFDFCFIVAPVVIFKPDTMVCASAAEVNCVTDLELMINLNQIKLISSLYAQFKNLIPSNGTDEFEVFETPKCSKPNSMVLCSKNSYSIKQVIAESKTDLTKDSGIDFEIFSANSTSLERPVQETTELPPFEFLINCGKVTMIVYDIKKVIKSEFDNNTHEPQEDDLNNVKQPLIYAMIDQPNFYFSQQSYDQKLQVSCFDIALSLGKDANESSASMPTESDFKVCLIETKNGEPHPDTGIPPSFLVIKYDMLATKNPQLNVIMGRPTKVHFSLSRLNDVLYIIDKVTACFSSEYSINLTSKSSSDINTSTQLDSDQLPRKYNVPDVNVTSKQLVISFKSDSNAELLFSLSSLSGSITNVARPEKMYGNLAWDSLIVSTILDSEMAVLLNPCSCNATICLVWESWQCSASSPQIQIQAESDCVYLDLGPKHILIIKSILTDYEKIMAKISSGDGRQLTNLYEEDSAIFTTHEQHYKDDLKSGAFQFVDGTAEELPFPYQVVFFSIPHQAMAWRYPHPRALTKIHVNPVPLESYDDEEKSVGRVPCAIEYWSESQMSYQRYVNLYLSETESYRLDLPDRTPLQVVACVWRIVLLPELEERLSSKALIGCLRIDSYFNPLIVPKIQAALNVWAIQLSLYNHLEHNYYENLPAPLVGYKLNGMIPERQCFAQLEYGGANFLFSKWPDGSSLFDLNGSFAFHVLDYGLLVLQEVLDSVKTKAQFSISDSLDMSLTCDSFSLKLSPSTFHTLALSTHLWYNVLDEKNKPALVLTTRYVIANDANIPIRFGQSGTDDNILLESRQCHFYSWRDANNQVLRIAVEENGWSWSKPFSVNADGAYLADFSSSSLDVVISINVTSLSASQKLVTFSGQLIISNQLMDSFEMKLIKYDAIAKNRSMASRDIFHIPPNSQPPSVVLTDNSNNMAMRLRFSSIANLSWTGDIPLQPNAKWGQPWLVKVPLQERGQFISIWVRIIIEQFNGKNQILAITSPLYMIRSYLPVPAKVQIETPSLKVSLNAVVNGRGERQQLYCPGTFEHFHQLTFQIESSVSSSNPYVPLSYSSVDQRKFFKRPEKESIKDVLAALESAKEGPKWPFQIDESCPWVAANQPQTHVQVKYEDAGLASSTLLLELQPWCFILNSLGTQLSIVSQDVELCRIPHYGIVSPPKLEGTFHIGVGVVDTFYMSSALQLVGLEWSQSFYMPRIQGLIPLEGNIKACVDCDSSISMISINSCMHKDMRVIRVSSNYVIENMTDCELRIATLAIPNSSTDLCLPNDLGPQSISISPTTDQRFAVPIVQWYTLFGKIDEPFILYISLQCENNSWSCPIRVDQNLSRRCTSVANGHSSIPLVITTQEDKSTVYIMIHVDKHPQLFIENMCQFKLAIGQSNEEADDIVSDTQHFTWKCQIESKTSSYYSTPAFGSRLPDLPNNNNKPISMLIAALPTSEEYHENTDNNNLHWSRSIQLSVYPTEQYIQLPHYGDIKLTMQIRCYTTFIYFTPISQVEISAQEVRSKIEKKSMIQQDSSDLIADNLEGDRTLLNLQSTSSSTSTTTFFSAQDEISEGDLSSHPTMLLNNINQVNKAHNTGTDLMAIEEYEERKILSGSATIHLQGFSIVVMKDVNDSSQRIEVASLCMIDTVLMMDYNKTHSNLSVYVGDLQFDNQMFEHGGYDFPVVLISQKPFVKKDLAIYLSNSLKKNIKNVIENSLLTIDLTWENYRDIRACKEVAIKVAPISAYIEGTYITLLMDYAASILPPCFVVQDPSLERTAADSSTMSNICVPDHIQVDAKILSNPLRLQSFIIEPVSILLSVHTSVHLYVAFDHSPLYFEAFDRKNLITTPYRLGNALAMHYLSGAIFGVGWVVGSLEILGSPGGLAQALGSGLKDFISMPFQGLLQGPWGFLVGITHGSASLVKHITAGTVNSVTKLASSVARNLDRLTLDDEHLQRQEESRRMRPQGVAQGLYQGLTGLGMSLLAAVAGIAHHPLQQVWSGETSTRGLVTGVGLGLVGVVTKPLSGAAELVALTGQGLLQGTGWNSLPAPRQRPVVQYSNGFGAASLRYAWRLMPLLAKSHDSILHVSNADYVMLQGSNRAVTLVLTRQALLIVNIAEDSVEKIYPLKDLVGADHPSDSSMLRLHCLSNSPPQHFRKMSPVEQVEVHMDQAMRARVAEFLRTSSTGIASVSTNSDAQSEINDAVSIPDSENSLTFYINSDSRSYLLSVFNVAKRQSQENGFVVI